MPINSNWYKSDPVTDQFRVHSLDLVCGSDEKHIAWIKANPRMQVLDAPNLDQVCHDYALTKILGRDPFSSAGPLNKQMPTLLDKLFTPIANPQNGDLVVYYYHNDKLPHPIPTHSGIARDDDLVESKWGDLPAIFIHPTFYTYYVYGEEVRYFTPNK